MSVIAKLSSLLGVKGEGPNIKLAEEMVKKNDRKGVGVLIENLKNKDKRIQSN